VLQWARVSGRAAHVEGSSPAAASAWAWHGPLRIFEEACTSCHRWTGGSLLTSYATLTGSRQSTINVAAIVISGEHRNTALST